MQRQTLIHSYYSACTYSHSRVQGCHFLDNNTNELPVQSSAHQTRKEDATKEYLSSSSLHTPQEGNRQQRHQKASFRQSLVFLPSS